MRRFLILAISAVAITGCTGRRVAPITEVPAARDWRLVATAADRARLRELGLDRIAEDTAQVEGVAGGA